MPSVFISLSSFSVNEEVVSKIEDELEQLKEFSEKDFPFQVQDMVNSTLALIDDCSKKDPNNPRKRKRSQNLRGLKQTVSHVTSPSKR